MWDLDFAGALGGDGGLGLGAAELAQGIGVIGFVGDDASRSAVGEEVGGGGAVVSLSGGEDKTQGVMRTPDRRIWSPMNHTFRPAGILNVHWSQ